MTGGTGLVGIALQKVVGAMKSDQGSHGRWVFLSSSDGDLRNEEATSAIFAKYKPTHVVHLAAFVGGLFSNMQFGVEFFENNMRMALNVLACAKKFGVKKCISCLSTCIFPDNTTYPIDETMVHNGAPHSSNEGYAYAKRMIDILNRSYSKEYGCSFTSIIPTNIYGPHDNFNIENGHVIPGLIHKLKLAIDQNTDFTIYGSGSPLRQFIYSEDLATLILWALENYNECEPIIMAPDEVDETSIADIGKYIASARPDFTGNIVFDTSKSDGQFKKTASNKKLRSYLPGFQFTSIADGIKRTVHWFFENYDSARK